MGYKTDYEYDALNRLTGVVDALSQRTSYGYDELGRMISQTDANTRITKFEYDKVGQRTAKVLPLGQRFSYQYDANGNLKSQTDANNQTATMTYDLMNRLTNESYQDGTVIAHTYNPNGQKKTVIDSRGTTSFNYDVRNRLSSRVDPDGKSISYTYDVAGNRTSVTIPSGTTSYTFDPLNRIDLVTNGSDITNYDYDAVGNLSQTILPNGVIETRSYDPLNRLLKQESKKDATVLSGFTYTLNPSGMRTAVTEQDGRKVDYKYDFLYRLTEEKITDATNGNRTVGYAMDKVGNRTSKSDSVGGTTSYVYDNNDRLLSETTGSQITSYVYDNNGNTKSKTKGAEVTIYTWNDEGRLVAVQNPNNDAVTYQYNENGIRISSTINGVKTSFLLDSNRDYAQVLEEYTSAGVQVGYVYGHDLISQSRSGTKSFYIYDGLGTTKALTNSSGVVTDRYLYDAYGNNLGSSGTTQNKYLYTGEQFDSNLGQYYLRDRYYSQSVGRFTRSDKYEGNLFSITNPISSNKYLYGNSNPVTFTDPKGLFATSIGEITSLLAVIEVLATFTAVQIVSGRLISGLGRGNTEWEALLTGIEYDGPLPSFIPQFSLSGIILGARNIESGEEGFWIIALAGVSSEFIPNLPFGLLKEEATLFGPRILGTASFFGQVIFGTAQVGNTGGGVFTIGFGYGNFVNNSIIENYGLALNFGYSQPSLYLGSQYLP
jgi:RHS repeat-associated protein